MSEDEFLSLVAARLEAGHVRVSRESFYGVDAVIGYRSTFRWRFAASRVNLFTVVACMPSVSARGLEDFSNAALEFGVRRKGRFRGLQTGVGVIAILASSDLKPDAIRYAEHKQIRRFGAFAWPVAYDLSLERTYNLTGYPFMGALYNSWMKQQVRLALGRRRPDQPRYVQP